MKPTLDRLSHRLPLAAACLLSALAGLGCPGEGEQDDDDSAGTGDTGCEEGDVAADFTLPDQAGLDVSLYDFAGMRVLLDFSALWCTPCADAAESSEAMQEELSAEFPFQYVVVVIQDEQVEPATVEDAAFWAEEFALTIPVLADVALEVSPCFLAAAGLSALPQFFVIDEAGVIRYVHVGYGTGDEELLKEQIRNL